MTDAATKICRTCRRELPADPEHFGVRSGADDGLDSQCIECRHTTEQGSRIARRIKRKARAAVERQDAEDAARLDAKIGKLDAVLGELMPEDSRPASIRDPRPSPADWRRNLIRLRIAIAPPGGAPDAGVAARALMAAADGEADRIRDAHRVDMDALVTAVQGQPELGETP